MENKRCKNLRDVIDQFESYGDKIALLSFEANTKRQITFRELCKFIHGLSGRLLKSGLNQEDTVVLLASNTPELIIVALSIIYAGGVCLVIDPQSDDEILNHIFKDSDAKRIFGDKKGFERWQKLSSHKSIEFVRLDDEKESGIWIEELSADSNKLVPLKEDAPAVLFYTSGTTGLPKGVPLSHKNIRVQIEAVREAKLLNCSDSALLPLPLFHVYPFVSGLITPLSFGLSVILPESITGPEIIRACKEGEATILIAVPRLLRALYTAIESKARSNNISRTNFDTASALSNFLCRYLGINIGKLLFGKLHRQFPKLRLLVCGGAMLEPDLARKLTALGWQLAVGYGLTETSPLLTIRMPDNMDLESVGKAIPGIEIRLQKTEDSEGASEQNEIQAKGASIFSGYRNLPDKTKQTFTKDGWFKTGDIGIFENGNLHIVGRISTTIKSEGGKKIQPDEIEKSFESEPCVREIGVLESNHKLVALIVPNLKAVGHENIRDKIAEVVKNKSEKVPSYYRITDFAISKDLLPRTNLGKIRRQELIDRYEKAKAAEKNEKSSEENTKTEISPEDKALLENPIAKTCWDWLTERFPDSKLTLDKSPQIDLNVDSLEWINLTLEVREKLGIELSEEAIARVDTLRDLLKEVVDASQSGAQAISPFDQPEHFIDEDQNEWLKPLGPVMSSLAYFLHWIISLVMHLFFRVSSQGLEKLPKGQIIFTPNHCSYLDPFAIASVLDDATLKKTQWAGWAGIALANPFNAFIYRLAHAVPIEAKLSLLSSLALTASVLKNGRNLIWFPEGEVSTTDEMLPFKAGIGMLLEHFSVPVVPVYIKGTRQALPMGAFFPRFNKITVIFGDAVFPEQLVKDGQGNNPAECIANSLHDRVNKLRPYGVAN